MQTILLQLSNMFQRHLLSRNMLARFSDPFILSTESQFDFAAHKNANFFSMRFETSFDLFILRTLATQFQEQSMSQKVADVGVCKDRIEKQLSAITSSVCMSELHQTLEEVTNDPFKTCWKYDSCQFCLREYCAISHAFRIQIAEDNYWDFCSPQCMIAVMKATADKFAK
jgi:hypothetical protein